MLLQAQLLGLVAILSTLGKYFFVPALLVYLFFQSKQFSLFAKVAIELGVLLLVLIACILIWFVAIKVHPTYLRRP